MSRTNVWLGRGGGGRSGGVRYFLSGSTKTQSPKNGEKLENVFVGKNCPSPPIDNFMSFSSFSFSFLLFLFDIISSYSYYSLLLVLGFFFFFWVLNSLFCLPLFSFLLFVSSSLFSHLFWILLAFGFL